MTDVSAWFARPAARDWRSALAGARAMLMGSDARRRRQEFGIYEASAVLLLSTEGDNRGIGPAQR